MINNAKNNKKDYKAAWITGILGIIGAILAAIIGAYIGKNNGTQEMLGQIKTTIGNIDGDYTNITINDIGNFVIDYEDTKKENESLKTLNSQLTNQLDESISENDLLKKQLGDTPILNFRDIKLSVNGEEIPINSQNSMVNIEGRDYFAKEIVDNLITNENFFDIKDGVLYIGKIIKDKSDLFEQWVVSDFNIYRNNSMTDSYGNIHTNAIRFVSGANIIYNLNNKYSLIKFDLSACESSDMNRNGVLTIKADDNVVYTSPIITKTTKLFSEVDVPINNCSLLTIEYSTEGYIPCIMSNAMIYN